MKAVTTGVSTLDETNARFLRAMTSEPQGAWRTFASVADLWRTRTPKRWMLLLALAGAGPVSVREAARRVGRDVRAVHADVQVLLHAGLLEKTAAAAIGIPFNAVPVDLMLPAAS